ncbi:hypothetical protein TSUD_32280 [Trifolium subterraneum]|uniref:J domain-containing protein n=1 Tax=Trifolium subterraneum TaxID=3900 RepID=A0A2Z6MQY4_TRISU|nr:hypothetical protein TSUD_32280 [Trifolium subterraneum]
MECNKEEAVRAKQLAEIRMQRGQFVEALMFANKAKKMYADVDNIAQILTERLSEEAIIKKQYRKLALLLHPDKNKFSGAEAAFKLIGEANSVLSDQAKRSLHDMKVKAHARAAVPKTPYQAKRDLQYLRPHPKRELQYLTPHPKRDLQYLRPHPKRELQYLRPHPMRELQYLTPHPITQMGTCLQQIKFQM